VPTTKYRKGSKIERIARLLRMGLTNSQIREVIGGNRQTINSIIWQVRNPIEAKKKYKKYYQEHKEERAKYAKTYLENNREEVYARNREWWAKNAHKQKCKKAGVKYERE